MLRCVRIVKPRRVLCFRRGLVVRVRGACYSLWYSTVAMKRVMVFMMLFPYGFLSLTGGNTKAATGHATASRSRFRLVLSGDTDALPVLPVFAARPVFCFARVADDDPRAGVLHEAFLDFLSRRPSDTLVEVSIVDGACPGGESVVVIDVDASAEADELRERPAQPLIFDDLVKVHVIFADLGNVAIGINGRTVDVLAVAIPRRAVVVDAADGVGAPEHERVHGVVWMVVDPDLERAAV